MADGDVGERPEWDEERAKSFLGATVLIGITRLGLDPPEQTQMFGVIRSAHERDGFAIELGGSRSGELYHLPPDLRNFQVAPPGDYRLRSTGEVVTDPDYTSSWTIHPPAH